ncbi:MAG TPA: DUF4179 domain-containing protein, partial [Bacillales bacterium]|nr:DUF4179 domain-containing protein [Bacillales bacterium]
MNFDDKSLNDLNEKYEMIHVPDSIDAFIAAGMKQGKKQKVQRFRMRMFAAAASLFVFIFAGTIRLSPAFASYVDGIPGFHQLVELIRYDQGLQDAVKNNFIQPVNRSVRHQGVTFTVKNVIADNSRMILFYTLDADHLDVVNLESVQLLDKN